MKNIAVPFIALGLLVTPAFMGVPVIGENSSVRAEEIRIGVPTIRVEDRDRDRDHRWRRDYDRDDVVVIKKHRRDRDRDYD
jgi:hypothetical protein